MLRNSFKIFLTLLKQYTVCLTDGGDSGQFFETIPMGLLQTYYNSHFTGDALLTFAQNYLLRQLYLSFLCTYILDSMKVSPSQLQVWKEDNVTQSQIW